MMTYEQRVEEAAVPCAHVAPEVAAWLDPDKTLQAAGLMEVNPEHITVNAKALRMAALYCAVKDVRFYLAGVYIAPCAEGGIIVTATNGKHMIQIKDSAGTCDKAVILQLDKAALSALAKETASVTLTKDGDNWTLQTPTAKHFIQTIDGKFPDCSSVIKDALTATTESCIAKGFDSDLLATANKAAKILAGKRLPVITLYPGAPKKCMVIKFDEYAGELECLAVIMPCTVTNKDTERKA